MNKRNGASGFTLVELAIVLVIIGLIVGGVLVGQDLIKAATIRAGVTQIEQYDTAVNTFHSKFNGIPGDLANQLAYFPNLTGAGLGGIGEGDNDGLVDSISVAGTKCTASTCISGEAAIFWYELTQAGFIPSVQVANDPDNTALVVDSTILPAFKLGKSSSVAVQAINGRNYWVMANFYGTMTNGTKLFTAGLSPVDALQLDTKFDDGAPLTGKAISIAITTALPGTADAAGVGKCALTTGSITAYNAATNSTVLDTLLCNMSIRTSF